MPTAYIYTDKPDTIHTPYFYLCVRGEDTEQITGIEKTRGYPALGLLFMAASQNDLHDYTNYIKQEIKSYLKGTSYRWWGSLEKKAVKFACDTSKKNFTLYDGEIRRLARYLPLEEFEAILVRANKQFIKAYRVH